MTVALAALPASAGAASPAHGSVSSASAETGWTGAVDAAAPTAYTATGGTQGLCSAPQCDTYTLEVREAAVRLELRARTATDSDSLAMEVVEPDGTSTYVYDRTAIASFKRDRPAAGKWTLRFIAGSGGGGDAIDYSGRATLVLTEPPAPEPVYPVSPEHPRSSPEVGTPSPGAGAPPPLRLRVGADATDPERIARGGLRVRVRCSGGCAVVRLRLVGGGRVIGRLAITRGAEGRAIGKVRILRRYKRDLRRAGSVDLRLVAQASAADGRTGADTLRLKLRR